AELPRRLEQLAEALVGGPLFKSLYSLLLPEARGRVATFALALRDGDQRDALVYAYHPNACLFDRVEVPRPREAFLAGMDCWGTDLLAVLAGELGPIALNFGRAYLWNALPQRFNFSLFTELYRLSHPLSRPEAALAIYQRLLRESEGVTPIFRAAAG